MRLGKQPPYFRSAVLLLFTSVLLTCSLGCGGSSSNNAGSGSSSGGSGSGSSGSGAPPPAPNAKQWTWVSGSSTVGTVNPAGSVNSGQPGVYGTQGTAAATNVPGGRNGAASWTDSSGNFWLFGGGGRDSLDVNGFLNDLWEFNLSTKQWTWIAGSKTVGAANGGHAGIYGTLGVAAATNLPGSRAGENDLTDKNGNFLLFGGNGFDESGTLGFLNDLWQYNPATQQWTWMSGSNSVGRRYGCQAGVYGTQGVAAASNTPGGRSAQASWIDSKNNYWIFGGIGCDSSGTVGNLNDLWEFSPATKMWTWISGSTIVGATSGGPSGVYGSQGIAAATNVPGGRMPAANWTDSSGNFWIFGGQAFDSKGTEGLLNDLWEFDFANMEWIWWGGSDVVSQANQGPSGVYGTLGTPASSNVPGGRLGSVGWTDNNGDFWLFGGHGFDAAGTDGNLNDLWKFDPGAKMWTWMSGSNTETVPAPTYIIPYVSGVYGTLGMPAPNNTPGSRFSSSTFIDSSGNLWLFGGSGNDATGTFGVLNDLWEYTP